MLKKNAAQTETDRRVAEENIQAITDVASCSGSRCRSGTGATEVPIRTFVRSAANLAALALYRLG
jgi:hypothetical protein